MSNLKRFLTGALTWNAGIVIIAGLSILAGGAFAFMGDEHAALVSPGIGERMAPGDPVTLTVPHCDPTVNLYDHYHVVAADTLVAIWPVSARGRAR